MSLHLTLLTVAMVRQLEKAYIQRQHIFHLESALIPTMKGLRCTLAGIHRWRNIFSACWSVPIHHGALLRVTLQRGQHLRLTSLQGRARHSLQRVLRDLP